MAGILADKDRIFLNIYGQRDWGLEGAKARGAWNGTADIVAQAPEWICDQIKASGLRGRGGAGFATGLKWTHAEGPERAAALPAGQCRRVRTGRVQGSRHPA